MHLADKDADGLAVAEYRRRPREPGTESSHGNDISLLHLAGSNLNQWESGVNSYGQKDS